MANRGILQKIFFVVLLAMPLGGFAFSFTQAQSPYRIECPYFRASGKYARHTVHISSFFTIKKKISSIRSLQIHGIILKQTALIASIILKNQEVIADESKQQWLLHNLWVSHDRDEQERAVSSLFS